MKRFRAGFPLRNIHFLRKSARIHLNQRKESSMTRREMEQLLVRYGQDIFGFCCYLTGSRDQGEELYQETMLKTIERMGSIQLIESGTEGLLHVRNYCMGIAIRQYRKTRQREGMHIHLSLDDEEAGISCMISDGLTPEELYEKKQEILSTRASVRRLPEKFREVIYLFYYAGQPIKEIAETLRIPQGTVKSRLNHAKKALERLLKEELI